MGFQPRNVHLCPTRLKTWAHYHTILNNKAACVVCVIKQDTAWTTGRVQEENGVKIKHVSKQFNHQLTSSSFSFLKHKHAALLLNPSPSYVLVWLGLNFIIYLPKRRVSGENVAKIWIQPEESGFVCPGEWERNTPN